VTFRIGHRLPLGFYGSVGIPTGQNGGGYSGHRYQGYGYGQEVSPTVSGPIAVETILCLFLLLGLFLYELMARGFIK
jgi:hypothetical protein